MAELSKALVLPFQKDVMKMNAWEVLDHIGYLRRTVAQRDAERAAADLASLSEEVRESLAKVARSDHETLATLDPIEASIREQIHG